MEDRRISKRKIKKPSYLDNFHTDDSKDAKPSDANSKGIEGLKKLVKEKRIIKIKPRSSIKTTPKQHEANKRLKRKASSISSMSKGKPTKVLSIKSSKFLLNNKVIKYGEMYDSSFSHSYYKFTNLKFLLQCLFLAL